MAFYLEFGALAPPLRVQLADAGLAVDRTLLAAYQKDANAIVRLRVRDLLSGAETRAVEQRLVKQIVRAAKRLPGKERA